MVLFNTLGKPRYLRPNEKDMSDSLDILFERASRLSVNADTRRVVVSNPNGVISAQEGTEIFLNTGTEMQLFVNRGGAAVWDLVASPGGIDSLKVKTNGADLVEGFLDEEILVDTGLTKNVTGGSDKKLTLGIDAGPLAGLLDHALLLNRSFATAAHTDFLSTNTAQTITAQKIIDAVTSLRFGDGSGPTLEAVAATNELDLTGDLDISGHLAVGTDASIDADDLIKLDETLTATGSGLFALMDGNMTLASQILRGIQSTVGNKSTTNSQTLEGVGATITQDGTGTVATIRGYRSDILSASSSGVITDVINFHAIGEAFLGGGAINHYGVKIDAPIGGVTNRFPFFSDDTAGLSKMAGKLRLGSTTDPSFELDITGDIRYSGVSRASNGTKDDPSRTFDGDTDTGEFTSGSGIINFTSNSNPILRMLVFGGAIIDIEDQSCLLRTTRVTAGVGDDFTLKAGDGLVIPNGGGTLFLDAGTATALGTDGSVKVRDGGGNTVFEADSVGFGLYGTTPVAQSPSYTITNVTTDRAYDADATSVDEIADVLGTLIADLQLTGIIG